MPTKIEWTNETWNPVTGCSKVSQGCKHCYALREWPRLAANPKATAYFGREFTDVACHPERLNAPLRWTKPRKIFVNSMSDLFHEEVPFEFIDQVFAVMALSRRHTFQVLTKRPVRMLDYVMGLEQTATQRLGAAARAVGSLLEAGGQPLFSWPLPNVWLGVSVEDQATADERIPILLQTPAAVRWISAEPLLGAVDLTRIYLRQWATLARVQDALQGHTWDESAYEGGGPPLSSDPPDHAKLDWVVVGGESGQKARPMHPKWAFSLRDQCAQAGVPFLFKQWGEWVPRSRLHHTFDDGSDCASLDPDATRWPCAGVTDHDAFGNACDVALQRVGKKMAGRLLEGVLHDGYPNIVG